MLEQDAVEELCIKREVRERHSLPDYEMILIINSRDDGKSWDWIGNPDFSKRWGSDYVFGLHHRIDPAMVDE
jgi:hypothetical protein